MPNSKYERVCVYVDRLLLFNELDFLNASEECSRLNDFDFDFGMSLCSSVELFCSFVGI